MFMNVRELSLRKKLLSSHQVSIDSIIIREFDPGIMVIFKFQNFMSHEILNLQNRICLKRSKRLIIEMLMQ